jgi:hypothetical protein
MKFGLFPTYLPAIRDMQTHYRGIIEQVEFADQIGIDYAWIVEHHFVRHGGLFPSNYAFLSYLAARTKRIRLGTGATVLPLNDPVRVAKQAATLDQLSQGRFDFGVGRGFIREEFEAFGVDMKDSRERVEEAGRASARNAAKRTAGRTNRPAAIFLAHQTLPGVARGLFAAIRNMKSACEQPGHHPSAL